MGEGGEGAGAGGKGAGAVVSGTMRQVTLGAARLPFLFPGVPFAVVAYVATACGLIGTSYDNLWGVLAAAVAGTGWYLSPLGRLESARRERLRAAGAG